MKEIIVVARCASVGLKCATFHFRGVYQGYSINKVEVRLSDSVNFIQNRSYVLWLSLVDIKEGVIDSTLKKWQEVFYG